MPNLSAKELSALEDLLNSEHLLVKKFNQAAALTTDCELKSKFVSVAAMHQNHYNKLLGYL